jgi:hypothetical protein
MSVKSAYSWIIDVRIPGAFQNVFIAMRHEKIPRDSEAA